MSVFFDRFIYKPENTIDQGDFSASGLFRNFNRYYGDDLMQGNFRGTDMQLSELRVIYHRSSTSSSSSSSNTTIFQGLFLKADLPFSLDSPIHILPRIKLDKMPRMLHFLFNKSQVNQHNKIHPGSVQKNTIGGGLYPIHLALVGNSLYFAAWGIRLFDPKFNQTIEQDKKQLEDSLTMLQEITGFISELVKTHSNSQ